MLRFTPLPTDQVRALQMGGLDAYGHRPERAISTGAGTPCRHCLRDVPDGEEMLILAHRPFETLHAYAETGPIFLCAASCAPFTGPEMPEILGTSPDYLIKGYSPCERIVYGTGAVVTRNTLAARAKALLENPQVVTVHVRSARNNCYLLRIDPSSAPEF
ncbi:MAG: DUF1203 domain-containing protein [Pseudomonadota bacterium]